MIIRYFFVCVTCKDVIHNPSLDVNTTLFHRHIRFDNKDKTRKILVQKEDREQLKLAAAKFVCKDLRPYYAIECDSLIDLCNAIMAFGQKYTKASRNDLIEALPSRNTVKLAINGIANERRKQIADILNKTKEFGGFAATTDNWTDNYKHLPYICVTPHVNIESGNELRSYRFVLL